MAGDAVSVRCPEYGSVHFSEVSKYYFYGSFNPFLAAVRFSDLDVVRFSEGPLWEVPLHVVRIPFLRNLPSMNRSLLSVIVKGL